jgi:hypothetical protein
VIFHELCDIINLFPPTKMAQREHSSFKTKGL